MLGATTCSQLWTLSQLILCHLCYPEGHICKAEMYRIETLSVAPLTQIA